MENEKIYMIMPPVLPHGWKKGVAKVLNIHINTVSKHLKRGSGTTYDRIMKTAKEKYGIPTKK